MSAALTGISGAKARIDPDYDKGLECYHGMERRNATTGI